MAELQFRDAAAAGYDRAVGHMTRRLVPPLLRAARLAPGLRVLDIATGTGLAAEAAAEAVGPSGHVIATDISPAMVERARERLGGLPNVSFAVEDGQRLTLPDGGFDAVLCNMGLMYFPDPTRGLSEFRRVLRPGGRAVVSVNTTPERSLISRVLVIIGRHAPSKAPEAARLFSLGDEAHLRALFEAAGFEDVETATETLRIEFSSFDRRLLRGRRAGRGERRTGVRGAAGGGAARRARGGAPRRGRRGRAGRGGGGSQDRQRRAAAGPTRRLMPPSEGPDPRPAEAARLPCDGPSRRRRLRALVRRHRRRPVRNAGSRPAAAR
jgi:ubiquinone/menaquinone biosynthesis C-methylase UbiE